MSRLSLTSRTCLGTMVVTLLAAACDQPFAVHDQDDPANVATEQLTGGGAALLVVGNTALGAGDAALQGRLQALGLAVTVRAATAVTASDATGKLVLISESVSSGDVNTKLRGVPTPVISFEPSLFDDMGFVDNVSTNYGTIGAQTSVALLGNPAAPTGDVSVTVTSSSQTFAWGRPVASANRIATVAGDATRAVIFSFERGAALSGLTAPARRAGWFATAGVPAAFTANGWSLFDALIRWAQAGVTTTCSANTSCPAGQFCVNGTCSTSCPAGFGLCNGACVDLSNSGTSCGFCGNTCASGTTCTGGQCMATSCASGSGCPGGYACIAAKCARTCVSDAGCSGGFACISGTCSATTCSAGSSLCAATCCPSTKTCQSGVCL